MRYHSLPKVGKPKIGENRPSRVRADVSISTGVKDRVKSEWEGYYNHAHSCTCILYMYNIHTCIYMYTFTCTMYVYMYNIFILYVHVVILCSLCFLTTCHNCYALHSLIFVMNLFIVWHAMLNHKDLRMYDCI